MVSPYSRRTIRASDYLKKIFIEISSNKGAYFSKIMNIAVSNNTCLRMIKSLAMPTNEKLHCIGIDDWAKRKGMNYGTIIVDADAGRPIDLLGSRGTDDVVKWLSNHNEIKYVTRDTSTAYGKAIREAIPEAKQIADRFHLVKNLSDAVQEEIKLEYSHLREVSKNIEAEYQSKKSKMKHNQKVMDVKYNASRNVEQNIPVAMMVKIEKLAQITKMKRNGHNISEIARKTELDRMTVRRYLAHGIPSRSRSTRVNYDKYMAEIKHMCSLEINPTAMYRSLRNIGLNCCARSFTGWFNLNFLYYNHKWNSTCSEPLKVDRSDIKVNFIPSFKKLSIFVTNPVYGVSKDTGECLKEKEFVDSLIKEIPLLYSLRKLHMNFRNVLKGGCAEQLDTWIKHVQYDTPCLLDNFLLN